MRATVGIAGTHRQRKIDRYRPHDAMLCGEDRPILLGRGGIAFQRERSQSN